MNFCNSKLVFSYLITWLIILTRSSLHGVNNSNTARLMSRLFYRPVIFRHFLGHFFRRKWTLRFVYERIRSIRFEKEKRNFNERVKIPFSVLKVLLTGSLGLEDLLNLPQNRYKNKLLNWSV